MQESIVSRIADYKDADYCDNDSLKINLMLNWYLLLFEL